MLLTNFIISCNSCAIKLGCKISVEELVLKVQQVFQQVVLL